MSTPVSFGDVKKLLKDCAPGHKIQLKTHFRIVYWKSKTFRSLPKNNTMEIGHVRGMVRLFGIMECAKKILPLLSPKKTANK